MAVANAVADGKITVVPEVLVAGGGGAIEGLAATLMRTLGTGGNGRAGRRPADDPSGAAVETAVDVPGDVDSSVRQDESPAG